MRWRAGALADTIGPVATLRTRSLFSSDTLRLVEVRCDGEDERPGGRAEIPADDQLVVVARGRFRFRDADRALVADPLVPLGLRAGREAVFSHPDGCGDVCLSIRCAAIVPWLDARGSPALSVPAQAALLRLAAQLRAGRGLAAIEVDELVTTALAPPPLARRPGRPPSPRERRLAAHMAELIALGACGEITVAGLAAEVGCSPHHACHVFRSVLGTSIHARVLEHRLRQALALALHTDWPLARVAAEAGFANEGHLGNWFRRRLGVAPGRARRGAPVHDRSAARRPSPSAAGRDGC